jgi:hypothetical protein
LALAKCERQETFIVTDSIDKFDSYLKGMRLFLEYVFFVQKTFPHVFHVVPKERFGELENEIHEAIYLAREIYNLPTLGSSPPDPLPVDPDCPDYLISDHMKERIGRNHPFFDLVNAPFTHPIGTQLAMICVDHAWNGHDTFVKAILGELKNKWPTHPNVLALQDGGKSLTTDEKLDILQIGLTETELADAVRRFAGRMHVKPEHAQLTLKTAKELRTAFAHNFGRATPWLLDLMREQTFQEFNLRIVGDELEVTTVLSRNIIEVIGLKAHHINAKVRQVYAGSPSAL